MLILCDFNRLKLNFKPPKKPWTLKLSKVVMLAIMNGRWNWQNLKNCEVQKKSDLIWTQSRKKSQFKSLQSLFKRTNNTQKMPAALVALYLHATIHATHQHFCSANHWAPQHSPSPRGAELKIAEVPSYPNMGRNFDQFGGSTSNFVIFWFYLCLIRLHLPYTPVVLHPGLWQSAIHNKFIGRKQLWFVGSFGVSTMACSRWWCHADNADTFSQLNQLNRRWLRWQSPANKRDISLQHAKEWGNIKTVWIKWAGSFCVHMNPVQVHAESCVSNSVLAKKCPKLPGKTCGWWVQDVHRVWAYVNTHGK